MLMSDRQRVLRAYYLFRLIAPFVFAMWLTVSMLYFVTRITSDPLQLAMLGVGLEIATVLFEVPTGVIADVYSRKWSIIIGYVIWGLGFVIQGLIPVYGVVLVSQLIWGLGFTFVSGAPEAWLVDELGEEDATPLFIRGSQIGSLSSLAGIISATLIGTIDVALPIVVGGLGTIGLAIILAVMMPENGFQPIRREQSSRWSMFETFFDGVREVRGHSVLCAVILIGIVIGISVGGFDALHTPHIIQNFTIPLFEPVIWFGIISGGVMLLSIPALEIAKRYMARNPDFPVASILAWFALGTILGNLVFAWTGNFYFALLAFWISQTLRNATKPLFMAWINQHTTSGVRATVISMYWQSNGFGQIIGTPIIGAIGSLVTLRIALTVSAIALLPIIPIYRRHRDDNQQ
jgi:MFS transporter, DHA3 family, tetracycline resistance protein